jgi:hypothetical protein
MKLMEFGWISNYACINCRHLSEEEANILDEISESIENRNFKSPEVIQYRDGWWVWIPEDELAEYISDFPPGLSNNFKNIILEAYRQGITYIQLDDNGPDIDKLKIYKWSFDPD